MTVIRSATAADYSTIRCCPYHGGWIRLSDCPIVATNDQLDAGSFVEGRGPGGDSGPPPDIVIDLATAGRGSAVGNEFVPGEPLTSRVDQRKRLIVAGPPAPRGNGKSRRFPRTSSQPLPAPAQLAAAFGGQRVRPVRACPHPSCHHPLPATIDTRDPISIAVVGNTLASKTTTLAALMHEIGRGGPACLGVRSFSPSEATYKALRPRVRELRDGTRVVQTSPQATYATLEFTTELGRIPVTVLIHDIAGEHLMNQSSRVMFAPYVLWADVVLFLYNPEESPRLNTFEADADQAAVLTGVLDDLEASPPTNLDGTPRWPRLVLAVSKADLLPNPPNLSAAPADDQDVIEALHDLGDAGVVHAAKRWGDVSWHFVAPQPPGMAPQGVTELFKRVLELALP
jgi:Double-GTPase 2